MGIKYTYQDSSGMKNFDAPGEYDIEITKAEAGISASSGADVIDLKFRSEDGATGQDRLFFTEAASWRVDVVLKALRLTDGLSKGHECELTPKMFVGRKGRVKMGWEEYEKNGEKKKIMKVKAWIIPEPKLESSKKTDDTDLIPY